MLDRQRFGLNRIIAPLLGLKEFLEFAASAGISKVELRNDMGSGDAVDNMPPAAAAKMASDTGVEIISINALQQFNLASVRARAISELMALLETANSIGCKAVVLCPNNDPEDARPPAQRMAETAEALSAFGPLFTKAGILGLIEPLGFAVSSLDSLVLARECIGESGFACYGIVHDTFHHYIGPEDRTILGKTYDVSNTGLVHVSGVEIALPAGDCRDEHRVLVGPADRMNSKEQLLLLDRLGYAGDFSFEPFSPAIQKLPPDKLADAVRRSLDYILA
jgi:2-keto-myo-inositol isomerase